MIDLDDVIALDREEAFLRGLSPHARAAYHSLASVRDRWGYVPAIEARAAVRSALERALLDIETRAARVAGRVAVGARVEPTLEAATKVAAESTKLALRVLVELDAIGAVRVGLEPGDPWRVWTVDEATQAAEVFG